MEHTKIIENEIGYIRITSSVKNLKTNNGEMYTRKTTSVTYNVANVMTITFKRVVQNYPTRSQGSNKMLVSIDLDIFYHDTGRHYWFDSHSMKAATILALCLISK